METADSTVVVSKAKDALKIYKLLKNAIGRKQQVSETILYKDWTTIKDISVKI